MGKLEGKVAVITGGSSGMALAGTKRFVEEGAHVSEKEYGVVAKRWAF
jgi:NAD(P)-dependent dehydrogenase (short-subunit alcohol dehydrogenase family)